MAPHIVPPQPYLRECFDYNQETGETTWRARPREHFTSDRQWKRWNTWRAGFPASSSAHERGHRRITINYRLWMAHRLIWKWMTGNDPGPEVDHKDRDPTNNRWNNLRDADRSRNRMNSTSRNRYGYKGVFLDSNGKLFRAQIRVNGKLINLKRGCATPAEAHAVYCEAARHYFGEFWSSGQPIAHTSPDQDCGTPRVQCSTTE